MFPEKPTATNKPELEEDEESSEDEVVLSEVVLSSSEVVEDALSVDADEPPSSLPQEIMVRLKRSTIKMCKILFIFSPISNERRRFEELLFQHFTNRLSIQFDIIAHSRPNFIYFKTFYSGLEGKIYKNLGFYLEFL